VLDLIDTLDQEREDDIITVIIPEFVLAHWWEQLLHNQSALLLRSRLRLRPNTIVTSVPTHISPADTSPGETGRSTRPPTLPVVGPDHSPGPQSP